MTATGQIHQHLIQRAHPSGDGHVSHHAHPLSLRAGLHLVVVQVDLHFERRPVPEGLQARHGREAARNWRHRRPFSTSFTSTPCPLCCLVECLALTPFGRQVVLGLLH